MTRTARVLALVVCTLLTGAVRPTPVAPARSAPIIFDPSKIRLTKDSFAAVIVQPGQSMPAGTETVGVHKVGTKLVFDAVVSAAAIGMTGTTSIESTTGLDPLRLLGRATFQGMSLTDSVMVKNGRATGIMQAPSGPGTIRTSNVDASVVAGLLLDKDELIVLLPTAELAEGATGSLSTLDEETGAIVPLTITVEGTEAITVPAGRFDVVRVRATGTDEMVAYVSTSAPRRVVRVNYSSAGIELRLLK